MRKIDADKFIDDCKSGDAKKVSDFISKFYSPATILSVILSGFDSDKLRVKSSS